MKTFNVPVTYRSPLIGAIKNRRKQQDKMKKDFTPTFLDLGPLHIFLARHFGFCYGVENAIEISFRTVDENPGKRIFLLSEMIHNPRVNEDLRARGVRFLQDTHGRELIPFSELTADDIVIIPAFGTTLEMEKKLQKAGIQTSTYNTTCPFVEKVWNRSEQIARKEYTVIVHGKPGHEETRATFSHAASHTPTLVIKDMREAELLAKYIKGQLPAGEFHTSFKGQYSAGFDPRKDLERIGVVNQTTMLASDTQAIADFLKQTMIETYQSDTGTSFPRPDPVDSQSPNPAAPEERFADTRDTLCYATLDNQTAVSGMLETPADLAIVVGGYNSSNTSHLVELCEEHLPTYFISSDEKILSDREILHYNFHTHEELLSRDYLLSRKRTTDYTKNDAAIRSATAATQSETPAIRSATESKQAGSRPSTADQPATNLQATRILITSGASCPDSMVEAVIRKLAAYFPGASGQLEELISESRQC
ncbi:MAG: 4-hydroxy-3-methylbut-2-enyl diphosphate reductase [Puia sp.]|nr:4-hydroxy-3-methylbut-2-enyl diphosphate reductase [Puia sp.]